MSTRPTSNNFEVGSFFQKINKKQLKNELDLLGRGTELVIYTSIPEQ